MSDSPVTVLDEAVVVSYSWNIFRYIADYLHLGGIVVLGYTLLKNRNTKGLSLKTQVLYFLVFITRYLDLLERRQSAYLTFFKLTYILTSLAACLAFAYFRRQDKYSYEWEKDTASMPAMIIPCIVFALLLPKYKNFVEIAWTFSEYLEAFAMVPQYIFCYRESAATLSREQGVLVYIVALGGYRVFYAFNWMYKFWMDPQYRDPQSWIGGLVEILFFIDFLMYQFQHCSILRAMVLSLDDNVNEVVQKVEEKILPGRTREMTDFTGGEMRQRRPLGNPSYDELQLTQAETMV